MTDADCQRIFDEFVDRSLAKSEWTHQAHLAVCWMTLQSQTEADAVAFLRKAIRRYNEATGVANTETAGYHETLTRYYVGAVAGLRAASIDEVLEAPECQIDTPLRFWSRDRLFNVDARAHWADPDLMPLPTRPR
jgi:hypothetical protein